MLLIASDSSTLIHLAAIGRLSLLREFYEKIIIPQQSGERLWRKEGVEPGRARSKEHVRRDGWRFCRLATSLSCAC